MVPGGTGPASEVERRVPAFDKGLFFDPKAPPPRGLVKMVEPVQPPRLVARLRIPLSAGGAPGLKFGDGVRVVGREILAVVPGVLTVGEGRLDVIPFHVVAGDVAAGQDLSFFGNILVGGDVLEGATLEGEDVYVEGNVRGASITARGDVWVGGEIAGMEQEVVEAHGRVFARSISNTAVQGLGDVVARDAIACSEISSHGRVIVTAERGTVVGGSVSALRGIQARTIGSDFGGTLTRVAVGPDFLTLQRLAGMEQRIREHEASLARIAELKRRIGVETASLVKIPQDKQDLYISLLRKEDKVGGELLSLRRGKERFEQSMKEFLEASVEVFEKLHPPVQVQIGEVIETIRERLEGVVLALGKDRKIVVRKEDSHGGSGAGRALA